MFAAVILQKKSCITQASAIKNTIQSRLELWAAGHYAELVNDCINEGKQGMVRSEPVKGDKEEVLETVRRQFNSMVLSRKIRGAVCFATE